jgi:hypothetical protein
MEVEVGHGAALKPRKGAEESGHVWAATREAATRAVACNIGKRDLCRSCTEERRLTSITRVLFTSHVSIKPVWKLSSMSAT